MYLDLGLLFVTSYASIYHIFHVVIQYWICNDEIIPVNFYNNLSDIKAMKKSAQEFSADSCNEGIFGNIIGALNSWIVKIKYPMLKGNSVKNQGSFFWHKDFYIVNVQAMVDSNKLIVWRLIR